MKFLKGQFVSEIKEELKKEMQTLLNKDEEKVERWKLLSQL